MIKVSAYIEAGKEVLWDTIILEFAKVFKTSPKKIEEKHFKSEVRTNKGTKIAVEQWIVIEELYSEFKVYTESSVDKLTTTYTLTSVEGGTQLQISEDVKGVNGGFRTGIFKIAMLPIFNRGYKKRLQARLDGIKYIVETKDNIEDNTSTH